MDSLVDDVNALVAPGLSTDAPDWCENCQALRKEIRRLQEEHGQNFGKLKQKIISTDLLIKKYKAKCEDYDLLCKKMEEVNKKSEKQMRQSSILETQLKAALLDVDPLRQSKVALESEVKEQTVKIQSLTDKVVAFEGTQRQYEYLTKASSADIEKLDAEKKELLNKLKTLESGKISKEAAKEYKVEISALKKENQLLIKNQQRLDKKLTSALLKIETLTQALKDAKSSPIRRRRKTSSSTHSPLKSPLRKSPKGRGISPKPSPSNTRRARTLSGREITFTAKDTGTSGSDSDSSDDKGSVSSLSWTFSPLVKCLSPLPPSPACFSNTVKKGDSDDSSLSDMADELEQQLAEDFNDVYGTNEPVEDTEQKVPSAEETLGENHENEDNENDTTLKEIEEHNEGEDLFDLSEYEPGGTVAKTVKVEDLKQENPSFTGKTDSDTQAAYQETLSKALHCEEAIDKKTEDVSNCKDTDKSAYEDVLDTKHDPVNIINGASQGPEKDDGRADDEKDVESIEHKKDGASTDQTSATPYTSTQKKRIAHTSLCNDQKRKTETNSSDEFVRKENRNKFENAKASTCLQSTKENESGEADRKAEDKDNRQSDEKAKQLPRTDTSEFIPVLHASTEALSDSEPDTESISVSLQDVPDCRGDASAVKLSGKPGKGDRNKEVDMEIEEQAEQVERQFPPNRGVLTRQSHLSVESNRAKHIKAYSVQEHRIKNISPKSKSLFKSSQKKKKGMRDKPKYGKHNFITFQKSSSGTLADEIDNLANDVDYVCNDRSEIASKTVNEVLDTKQIDVTKLNVCKRRTYKDLDNIADDSSPEFCKKADSIKDKHEQIKLEKDLVIKEQEQSKLESLENEKYLSDCKKDVSVQEECEVQKENSNEITTLQPSLRNSECRAGPLESDVVKKKMSKSQNLLHSDDTDAEKLNDNEIASHEVSDSGSGGKQEGNKQDADDIDTHEELSELVSISATTNVTSETDKMQTTRQLSTGFVVTSPYSDRLSESPSPSIVHDKEKHEKKKTKLKGPNSSLCETVLENIQEEEGHIDSVNNELSNSDKAEACNVDYTNEINQPGCSYHYNDQNENVDNALSSSVSLSEEIEKIMEKPGPSGSRVISCTPDLLDSEIAEFSHNDSGTTSPSGDSVERRSPLSPLPDSPFEFIIPVSPLPPSPLREIVRVSPLSPTHFVDDDSVELEHQASTDNLEIEENTIKTEVKTLVTEEQHGEVSVEMVLTKTTSDLFSLDDLKLCSIPAAISPIKTPEHRKTSDKLKRSKTSAFKKVSKPTVNNKGKPANDEDVNVCVKTSSEHSVNSKGNKTDSKILKSHSSSNKQTPQDSRTHESMKQTRENEKRTEEKEIGRLGNTSVSSVTGNVGKKEVEDKDIRIATKTPDKQQTNPQPPKVDKVKEDRIKEELLEVPTGHENLVAVKKKTRLAHRPNIQTLKPQKVQVIEAQALPIPTVGRKRKTLDTGDKDGQGKKQYKGATFQKQKESTVSKEETKRMQVFLKSLETPESFVTKATGTEQGDFAASRLVDCCIECLGRNRTDSTDVVYKVCQSDDFRSCQLQWPFLSDVEKQATKLLKYLYSHEHLKTPYRTIMCRLWDCIVSSSVSLAVVGQMCFCRVFTALCSLEGDVEQARVLFYHMVAGGQPNYCLFIVPMVSVWPEVLKKSDIDQPDKTFSHGLLIVLEEVVTRTLQAQDLEVNKKIVVILQKLCGWRGSCGDTEVILKALLARMSETAAQIPVNQDPMFELMKAVHLLSVVGGWPWFKEFFIMRNGLQTAANKYKAKNINKPAPPAYMSAILKITGSVTSSLSASVAVKDIEQFTRIWIFPILAQAEGDLEVSRSCVEVLLELSPLLPNLLKGISSRLASQPASVRQGFGGKLEALKRQYQANMLL